MDFDLSQIEGFEWDEGNLEHIKKHGVSYKECEDVFFNKPLKVHEDKRHSRLEKRLQALGQTNNSRLLIIVFTVRGTKIRIISGRDQNKKEKIMYRNGGEK